MLRFSNHSSLLEQVYAVREQIVKGEKLRLSTSGTTGTPKLIEIDTEKALRQKRKGSPKEVWLLTYDPNRWAGVSVVMHVMQSLATLCVPDSLEFSDLLKAIRDLRPTHISLTPSMFRNLTLRDSEGIMRESDIVQITFGGEYAKQSVLNLAKTTFPSARVSHVYASTENGDICAVSDGLEGVPADKFRFYQFDGDELVIDGRSTGDLWELRHDRFYFEGRKEDIINVGGNKVSPLVVEEFAISNGAAIARAYSIPSSLLGSLVGLDYVGSILEKELLSLFRASFPKYACPAIINKYDQLDLSQAGKLKRKL